MKKAALFVMLILLLLAGQTAISGQERPAAPAGSPLGTAFTYQGLLQSGGEPVDDNCDFEFSLWDAAIDGNPVGDVQPAPDVPVVNGMFAVQLDFGSGAFSGEARWLETAVRCPAGSGNYTTLSPRQALNPVPYAMFSQDLGLPFNKWTDSTLPAFDVENRGEGPAGRFGIDNPESDSHALKAHSNGSMAAFGAFAWNEANAINALAHGSGTVAHLQIDNQESTGSLISASTNGLGMGAVINIDNPENDHTALKVSTHGSGPAISGWSFGSGAALSGQSEGTGDALWLGIRNPGSTAYLIDASTNGLGPGASIRIGNPENDHTAFSASTDGTGGAGSFRSGGSGTTLSAHSTGSGHAFFGWVEGAGRAAHLRIENPDNTSEALRVETNGLGTGASIGVNNADNDHSALSVSTDGSGQAASFRNEGTGDGVSISSPEGTAALTVIGGSKNAVVGTSEGARLLYAEESSQVWFTDYGFGRLADGSVFVAIDSLFAETVNLEEPYHVFVQAYGDADLYVSERTPQGFQVRLRAGDPDVEFSYRLVATRRGYEGQRLERAAWADDDPNLSPAPQEGGPQ